MLLFRDENTQQKYLITYKLLNLEDSVKTGLVKGS